MNGPAPAYFPGTVSHVVAGRIVTIAIIGCIAALMLAVPAAALSTGLDSSTVPDGEIGREPADPASTITMPAIGHNATPGTISRQYTFSFQQENITLETNVSAAVYYGAKNGDKFATAPPGTQPESLAPGYYRAFIDDPAQDPLYADLIGSFHAIRQQYRYSDDEYLELLTVFVQSLSYDNTSATRVDTVARFPAETIVDGTGDCDDKSLLLASLLSREGYNVSLLLFIPEHHMALGVKSEGLQYNDTGYMYVETTGVSFMGDVPKRLNQSEKYLPDDQVPGTIPLASAPIVIRVGSGSKGFTHSGEIEYIITQKNIIDARVATLRTGIDTSSREDPSRFRALLERYNRYAEIHNFIAKHRYDRAGTYRYLSSILLPACTELSPGTNGPAISSSSGDSSVTPAGSTAGGCTCPKTLAEDPYPGYIPCPRGIRVPEQCIWQSIRQVLVHPTCQPCRPFLPVTGSQG